MLNVIMLSVTSKSFMLSVANKPFYAECLYAECRYAECHYVECRAPPILH
jgi:hypothetical protein